MNILQRFEDGRATVIKYLRTLGLPDTESERSEVNSEMFYSPGKYRKKPNAVGATIKCKGGKYTIYHSSQYIKLEPDRPGRPGSCRSIEDDIMKNEEDADLLEA